MIRLFERWRVGRRPVVVALEWTKRHIYLTSWNTVHSDRHHSLVARAGRVGRCLWVGAPIDWYRCQARLRRHQDAPAGHGVSVRSEEHTSELQELRYLV